jgi:hypothetical protein
LSRACRVTRLGLNVIFNKLEFELELARILNESSLNMQFIARLEFELDYLGSTHKRASLEIFKLDSARLDYIPSWYSGKASEVVVPIFVVEKKRSLFCHGIFWKIMRQGEIVG